MKPPVAEIRPHPHILHGDVRPDDYDWLKEREKAEVIRYLEAENAYADEALRSVGASAEDLYADMLRYVQEEETEVPVKDGPYYYYSRTVKGKPYRIYARRRAHRREDLEGAVEEILLDVNHLAEGSPFYSVTEVVVSPDHRLLAFLENRTGTDRYTLRIKDLASGEILPEAIPDVFLAESLAWSKSGGDIFYLAVDETQRASRLMRHRVGSVDADALVYEERDTTSSLTLTGSATGDYLFLCSEAKTWTEVRSLPSDRPEGEWTVVRARRPGIEYSVEDKGDGEFWVLTNEGAENFRLATCQAEGGPERPFREALPYDRDVYLEALHPFRDALLISGRAGGLAQVFVVKDGRMTRLPWPDALFTARVGENRSYETTEALISYESFLTPESTYALDTVSGQVHLLQRKPTSPAYDPSRYREERLWSRASDGTMIPVSLVSKVTVGGGAPSPCLLQGYGSYGLSSDPHFDPLLFPLLDRGVVFAVAHVRGGGEMGRPWYHHGKLMEKRNTFTDFVDVARDLISRGVTSPDRLAARGRSAGGLLMGAILNMAPELFRVVVAGVPFVDVVTTMLDDSIPLTSLEWDEWGDPRDAQAYAYIKSYSPYDNVQPKDYPAIYVTTGLNDPRVGYFEPAKWVAKLRATKTDANLLILKTKMGAGHMGSSDRYQRWRDLALEEAFVLDHIGRPSSDLPPMGRDGEDDGVSLGRTEVPQGGCPMKQVHTDVLQDARAIAHDLTSWRRRFHSRPELSFKERETTDFLARTILDWGLDPVTKTETGLWVDIEGKGPGKTVLIRADIDALPVQEVSDAPYRSQNDGVMHACGHDGHTAMALGDVRLLLERREDFSGRVRVLFQPAEEKLPGGALDMIKAGCLDGVDVVIGLHLTPVHTAGGGRLLEAGQVGIQAGPVMANADDFSITVRGKGGHGAMPHLSVDAIAVASAIVSALQQVVSRMVDPLQPAVLTVGTFKAGYNFNVIAPEATLTGTVRTFDASTQERIIASMERVARDTASALGAEIDFHYPRGYPTLVNLPAETEVLKGTAVDLLGEDALVACPPMMGGEDFAYYLHERPGAFAFLGCGNAEMGATFPNHHPSFAMDEAALPYGTALLTATALRLLEEGA